MRLKKLIPELTSTAIILLFSFESYSRLKNFELFREQIDNQPLPNDWTPLIISAVPGTEIVSILLLFFPRWRLSGLWLSAAFFAVYTFYNTLILLNFFSVIPCSCAGAVSSLSWTGHLILVGIFLIASIAAAVMYHGEKKPTATRAKGITLKK